MSGHGPPREQASKPPLTFGPCAAGHPAAQRIRAMNPTRLRPGEGFGWQVSSGRSPGIKPGKLLHQTACQQRLCAVPPPAATRPPARLLAEEGGEGCLQRAEFCDREPCALRMARSCANSTPWKAEIAKDCCRAMHSAHGSPACRLIGIWSRRRAPASKPDDEFRSTMSNIEKPCPARPARNPV